MPHLARNVHKLACANSRQHMPPPMKLQRPRPRQSDRVSETAQLGAELEVNVPQPVADEADDDGLPRPDVPIPGLGLGERGADPVEQVLAAEEDEEDARGEGDDLVDYLGRLEVEGDETGEVDGQADGDEPGRGGRLARGEADLQHRPD